MNNATSAQRPTGKVSLRHIAHARAGDKGNISSIGLFVFEPQHYEAVKAQVTPELLKEHFGGLFVGEIHRFEIDHLHALNFVMHNGLEGGVNSSLNLDAHGKSFSFLLLALEISVESTAQKVQESRRTL